MDQEQIREEARILLKAQEYVLRGSAILGCQRKCLTFDQPEISEPEQECLYKCADKYAFLDLATYELDTTAMLAEQQGKPKKAFMYYTRRIEDLTRIN